LSFSCELQFSFLGSNLSSCAWNSDGTQVLISGADDLTIDDQITLLPNVLRSQCLQTNELCLSYPTSQAQQCLVAAPEVPVVPIVSMVGSSEIGFLDELHFDISASSGSGGRSWKSVSVVVTALPGQRSVSEITSAGIANSLQDFFPPSFASSKLVIPSSYLPSNYTYFFNTTVCNFLKACSRPLVKGIFKELIPIPVITIYGSADRTIHRSDLLTISASAYINTSQGVRYSGSPNSGLSFDWEVFSDSTPIAVSTTKVSRKVKVAPYSFEVGMSYSVRLTVTSSSPVSSATSSITLRVKPSELVGVINDGQQMYIMRQGGTLLLDGSESYDEDIYGLKGLAAGLSFEWGCSGVDPSIICTSYFSMQYIGEESALKLVSLGGSLPSTTFQFSLTVSSSSSGATRTNTVQTSVRVVSPTTPTLSLTGPRRITRGSTLVLTGFVNSSSTGGALWSSESISNLKSLLLTPIRMLFSKGSNRVNLVLPRNTLTMGSSYTFHLSAENTTSWTCTTVAVLTAPRPGVLTFSRSTGIEYQDRFQFNALYWSDTELPLAYSYGYYSPTKVALTLKSASESTSLTTLLPQGNLKLGNLLTCFVIVSNFLQASTQLNATVVVNPLHPDQKRLVLDGILSRTNLTSLSDESDFETIREEIVLGTSILNSVNCSSVTNCDLLNREECGEISNQCGSCLLGFVEIDLSDPHSICLPINGLTPATGAKSTCSTSTDCSSLQICQKNQCVFSSKSCASNCSNHGVCRFEQTSTGKNLDVCTTNDVTCRAVCECNSKYTDTICSTKLSQLHELRENRYSLIKSLNSTFRFDDLSEEGLVSLMALLVDLSSSPTELTTESCALLIEMVGAVTEFIASDTSSNLNYEDLVTIFPIFDTCLSLLSTEDSARTRYNQIVEEFISSITSTLMAGLNPLTLIQPSMRMTAVTQSNDQNEMISVTIPSTPFEASLGTRKSSVVYSSTAQSSISLSAVESLSRYQPYEMLKNKTKRQSTSNSLRLMINRLSDSSSSSEQEESANVTIVLQYEEEQFYGNITDTNYTITTSPTCGVVSDDLRTHCTVTAFTTRNTTCLCQIPFSPSSSSGRRLSSDKNQVQASGVATILSMTEYTYAGFVQTTVDSNQLTSAELKSSYLVVTMFLTLWTLGALFLFEDLRITGSWFVAPQKRIERRKNDTILLGSAVAPVDKAKEISMEVRKKYLYAYLNSIFPDVFHREGSTWNGLMNELRKHHRYIAILRGGGTFSHEIRVKTVLQMLTVQTMLMFVLALCYDLQYPSDNGQCSMYTTQASCLKPSSMFDSSQQMCEWMLSSSTDDDQTVTASCLYLKPDVTLHMIALISILVSIVTAPFNLVVDFLFDIIRAPTADSDRLAELISSGNTSIQRVGRRMSAVAIGAKKAVVSRVSNMIPVKNHGSKSTIKYVMDNLVRDVTRDVPDFVVHRHALASKALGDSFREVKVKPKAETVQTLTHSPGFIGRKQRAAIFLSESHPTPPIDITLSAKEAVPFNSIAPATPPAEPKALKQQSAKAMYESLVLELSGEYDQLTSVNQRGDFISRWG
jgi:hypothetical protein